MAIGRNPTPSTSAPHSSTLVASDGKNLECEYDVPGWKATRTNMVTFAGYKKRLRDVEDQLKATKKDNTDLVGHCSCAIRCMFDPGLIGQADLFLLATENRSGNAQSQSELSASTTPLVSLRPDCGKIKSDEKLSLELTHDLRFVFFLNR